VVFLKAKHIFLRPLSEHDILDAYLQWINDQETTKFMGSGKFPLNNEGLKNFLRISNADIRKLLLGIFLNKSSVHIGNIAIENIDTVNRNAEIGIIIGDKRSRGKGYATEAIMLVADHAFNKLNLHKLYTGMVSGNETSKRVFEKAGFHVEGILREHFYLNGAYLDCYRMGLLRKDHTSAHP